MIEGIFTGTLFFSHIIPVILGFFGVILIASGIMDNQRKLTYLGITLFIVATISPFLVLSMLI